MKRPDLRGAWPHVRAALIVVHLVAITLMALPAPGGGMNRKAWKDPTVQAELTAWATRLSGWGLTIETGELEDHLWDFSTVFMSVRTKALAPFRPYYRTVGTSQSWRMFVAPHRYPSRLEVAVEREGSWQTIYVARSPDKDWRHHQLDNDRIRSIVFRYGWKQYRSSYNRFARWLSDRAFEDFPDVTRVRVRFSRYRTLTPTEARDGVPIETKPTGTRVFGREP